MINFRFIINRFAKKILHPLKKRIKISDKGIHNKISIGKSFYYDKLYITFNGNDNEIIIGDNCRFMQTNHLYVQGEHNKIQIGNNVSFDQNVGILVAEGTKVTIEDNCMFAEGVRIRTSDQHPIYSSKDKERINKAKDVHINNGVWLGANVVVNKGCTIGMGSIVGINSIVTKDIEAGCVAVGVPAKVVKENVYWSKDFENNGNL